MFLGIASLFVSVGISIVLIAGSIRTGKEFWTSGKSKTPGAIIAVVAYLIFIGYEVNAYRNDGQSVIKAIYGIITFLVDKLAAMIGANSTAGAIIFSQIIGVVACVVILVLGVIQMVSARMAGKSSEESNAIAFGIIGGVIMIGLVIAEIAAIPSGGGLAKTVFTVVNNLFERLGTAILEAQ